MPSRITLNAGSLDPFHPAIQHSNYLAATLEQSTAIASISLPACFSISRFINKAHPLTRQIMRARDSFTMGRDPVRRTSLPTASWRTLARLSPYFSNKGRMQKQCDIEKWNSNHASHGPQLEVAFRKWRHWRPGQVCTSGPLKQKEPERALATEVRA